MHPSFGPGALSRGKIGGLGVRKNRAIWLLVAGIGLALVVGLVVWVRWATRQVPAWYQQAVAPGDPAAEKKASDEMEQRAADLASGFSTTGRWEVTFTEQQINGWLADGLKRKHPDLLPEGFSDPRVRIQSDGVTGACRVEHGVVSGVVSLTVEIYLAEPNVVAARIRRARLGRLPWPLTKIMGAIEQSARDAEVPLGWRESEGDPVSVIRIPDGEGNRRVRIESLLLEDGRLYIAGVTGRPQRAALSQGR
jgi:hypothetical protein